ncbi:MAG: glycerol-3-phosphate acyltransferase [Patescibacteria group bacterium]|nr:glycerol-3-phosphate acyltransferase [Patescibacteria group bacterium]MBU1877225.1 glycerol-3-phosphate acyltransferase [Patescibacteria group bacterium]
MLNIFFIILSYLLGSFPSGHIITKLSVQKDILEIGWRKTSGSNVFKNIGIWQGALTGLLDILKGYLAVRLAQYYGQPDSIQVLCGVAAVVGHNWSLFLKFNGGRGIGTFGGALYAFSPVVFKFSLIPFLLLGIIWNLSIGTIVMLVLVFYWGNKFGLSNSVGQLVQLSLLPIFLKRLSPIKELKDPAVRRKVLLNRLIFDDDFYKDWRIKRIVKKLTKN